MRKALEQAKEGRLHILAKMKEACDGPNDKLPPSLPKMRKTQVDPAKVLPLLLCSSASSSSASSFNPVSPYYTAIEPVYLTPVSTPPHAQVGKVIGSGGSTIKGLIEDCGVSNIAIEDGGVVTVSGEGPSP